MPLKKTFLFAESIPIEKIKANTGQIEGLPKNPRLIKDDRYQKLLRSIQDDPEMMQLRELIVYPLFDEFIVIGGNMRLAVLQQLGYQEAPCKVLPVSTSIEKLKAYSIKDNVSYGDWNMETLIDEWDNTALNDWGLEMPELNQHMVGEVNEQGEWVGLPDFEAMNKILKIVIQFETEKEREDFEAVHNLRCYKGKRIPVSPNIAIRVVEDFTDRYENVGISGFNYTMFVTNGTIKPFVTNCHVYSATLLNNRMPYKWRLKYNEDTDICLQVLTNGLCTISFNAFNVQKATTMSMKGGNTDQLYKADGRLKMARSLEAIWPEWVTVKWRYGRPQHVVKNSWRDFKTPLIRRKDIDFSKFEKVDNYGLELIQKKEIKSANLQKFFNEYHGKTENP